MSAVTDSYADWDAAYVLGALDARERRAFERHLAVCPNCASRVAELAGMPGLLARVPFEDLPDGAPESVPVEPVPPAPSHRTARRVLATAGVALVAAATAAVLAIGGLGGDAAVPPSETQSIRLASTGQGALSAEVRLVPEEWGTAVSTHCRYAAVDRRDDSYGAYDDADAGTAAAARYGLYVTDDTGTSRLVSSWSAAPGSDVRTDGSTDLPISRISLVDIRSMDSESVLLESPVPPVP